MDFAQEFMRKNISSFSSVNRMQLRISDSSELVSFFLNIIAGFLLFVLTSLFRKYRHSHRTFSRVKFHDENNGYKLQFGHIICIINGKC